MTDGYFCPYCDGDGHYESLHIEIDENDHVLCSWVIEVECEVCKGHGIIS